MNKENNRGIAFISSITLFAVLMILAMVTLSFGEELPAHGIASGGSEVFQLIKEALPQIVLLAVFLLNLGTSIIDSDRNFKATLVSTMILVGITYWGDFYKPLLDFLNSRT